GVDPEPKDVHAAVCGALEELASVLVPDPELLVVRKGRNNRDAVAAANKALRELAHEHAAGVDVGWKLNDQDQNAHQSAICRPCDCRSSTHPCAYARNTR